MERGDIVTLAAGIIIVIVIAVAAKYGGLFPSGHQQATPTVTSGTLPLTVIPSEHPATDVPMQQETVSPPTTVPTPIPTLPDPVPYRIFYTAKPLEYPVFRLPDNMESFGASEIPWKGPDVVVFALIEETRSGITEKFSIPYGLWRVNITVDAWKKPQYARFDMVVCYAKDGRVIDGLEILNKGSAYRNIQVSNTDMYIIIHTEEVDRFRITFETPRTYYNNIVRNT